MHKLAAVELAKRVELLQKNPGEPGFLEPGFLAKLTTCGVVYAFVDVNEAPGYDVESAMRISVEVDAQPGLHSDWMGVNRV